MHSPNFTAHQKFNSTPDDSHRCPIILQWMLLLGRSDKFEYFGKLGFLSTRFYMNTETATL